MFLFFPLFFSALFFPLTKLQFSRVWHESGHGLTTRTIGNMMGAMSGAVGEGASDALALIINNNDDVIAEYAAGRKGGIRTFPYTNYQVYRTYGDMIPSVNNVHFNGEIFAGLWFSSLVGAHLLFSLLISYEFIFFLFFCAAAIMYRIIQTFKKRQMSLDVLLDYYVAGMMYIPSGPSFEHMRDGILAAISASNIRNVAKCIVWESYALFGVGVNATGNDKTVKGDFSLPAGMSKGWL